MSADASGDLARVAAGLRNEMRGKVNTLRVQLTEELRRIDRTLARSAEETGARLSALAAEQAAVRRELHGSSRRAGRLEGELQQIEGLLRRHRGEVPADLDTVPAELRSLVEDVRAAERIRSTVLDDDARTAHHRQIEACAQGERELAEIRQSVLAASRTLAVRKAGGWAFRRAVTAYRSARARLAEHEADLVAVRAGRDAAESELRDDATRQQAYRAHPGAAAVDRLAAHVRERIDTAVAGHELLPSWFTTVLGHRPVPARAAEWRDTAVEVVLYRITQEVTDRVVALGPPPRGGHRAARHDAVQAALRRLDE